jgi:pilus assembly protein CpaE
VELWDIVTNYTDKRTENIKDATCAIIEVPGYDISLNEVQHIPVLVVVSGMVTLAQWRKIRNFDVISLSNAEAKIGQFISQQKHNPDLASFEIRLDEVEENKKELPQFIHPGSPETTRSDYVKTFSSYADSNAKQVTPQSHFLNNSIGVASEKHQKRGDVIASFSAAGGVGKTFVSINIAGFAAIKGVSSVVVDLDFGFGDVDIAIGLVDPRFRNKIVDTKAQGPRSNWVTVKNWTMYADNLKENMLRHSSGLYVIPSYPFAGTDVSIQEIRDLITSLTKEFSLVMIDLGVNAFDPQAKIALELADTIFLVGGQDNKTVGKIVQFMEQENYNQGKLKFIVNMVESTGYYSPKEVASKLGFKKFDEIPLDNQGVNAASKARKLPVQLKGSTSGQALKSIAFNHLSYPFENDENNTTKSFWDNLKLKIFRRK